MSSISSPKEVPKRVCTRQQICADTKSTCKRPSRKSAWRHHERLAQFLNLIQAVTVLQPAKLSLAKASVLSRGLKFVPYKSVSDNDCLNSIDNFLRSYAATYKFDLPKHPYLPNNCHTDIPSNVEASTDQYVNLTKNTFLNRTNKIYPHRTDNLTKAERQILNKLQHRKDIIIKKSDKGDKIVVETVDNYINDVLKHLSNTDIYHRLEKD